MEEGRYGRGLCHPWVYSHTPPRGMQKGNTCCFVRPRRAVKPRLAAGGWQGGWEGVNAMSVCVNG